MYNFSEETWLGCPPQRFSLSYQSELVSTCNACRDGLSQAGTRSLRLFYCITTLVVCSCFDAC